MDFHISEKKDKTREGASPSLRLAKKRINALKVVFKRRRIYMPISKDIDKILVTETDLKEINCRLGAQITNDFKDKKLLVVGILKGSIYFMTDLTRCIDLPLKLDFLAVSSYGSGTRSSGSVRIIKDIDIDLEGYDILLIEDILDSGRTLQYVSEMLKARKANSISICTLLDKPERRVVEFIPTT